MPQRLVQSHDTFVIITRESILPTSYSLGKWGGWFLGQVGTGAEMAVSVGSDIGCVLGVDSLLSFTLKRRFTSHDATRTPLYSALVVICRGYFPRDRGRVFVILNRADFPNGPFEVSASPCSCIRDFQ